MKRKRRCIVHLDMDAFYAQVESVRLGIDSRVQPYALEQWNNFLAVNYPAREFFGIKRMDSVWEGKRKVLEFHLQHPEYQPGSDESRCESTPTTTATTRSTTMTKEIVSEGTEAERPTKEDVATTPFAMISKNHPLQGEVAQVPSDSIDFSVKVTSNPLSSSFCGSCNSTPPKLTLLYSPIPLYHVGEVEYSYYPPNPIDTEVGDVLHLSKTSLSMSPSSAPYAFSSLPTETLPRKPFSRYNRTEFKVSLEPFRSASQKIFAVLRSFPGVEVAKAGIDEAFLDVTDAAEEELRSFILASRSDKPPSSFEGKEAVSADTQQEQQASEESNDILFSSFSPLFPGSLPWSSLGEICRAGLLEPSTVLVRDQSDELQRILEEKGSSLQEAYDAPMQWLRDSLVPPVRGEEKMEKTDVGIHATLERAVRPESKKIFGTGKKGVKEREGITQERSILLSNLSPHLSLDYFFPSELSPSVLSADENDKDQDEKENKNKTTITCPATPPSCAPVAEMAENVSQNNAKMVAPPATRERESSTHRLTTTEGEFLLYAALLAAASRVVFRIRENLYRTLRYDCSAGIAHNCLIAKILSASHKPRKQVLLWPHLASSVVGFTQITKMRGFGGKWGNLLTRHNHQLRAVEIWDRPFSDAKRAPNITFSCTPSCNTIQHSPPPIHDVHSFFRVRGADSNIISPPQIPHMWSSLKEFPKPMLIRHYSQLEGWIGALCHDLWCRHRYYEEYYRPYFSHSSSRNLAMTSSNASRKTSRGTDGRVGCYAKVVQIRVEQWTSSGYQRLDTPKLAVTEERKDVKEEIRKKKEKSRADGERDAEQEMRSGSERTIKENKDDNDDEERRHETNWAEMRSSEEDEADEEEEDEELALSESYWGNTLYRKRPLCKTWKRESLLLEAPKEAQGSSSLRSSGATESRTPLITLQGLLATATKLLRELEPSLLREGKDSAETPGKDVIRQEGGENMLQRAWRKKAQQIFSTSCPSVSLQVKDEEERRQEASYYLSPLVHMDGKEEHSSLLPLPSSCSFPVLPCTAQRSEEHPALLYPIRSIIVSFQYSKAKKYSTKKGEDHALVNSAISPSQTLTELFLRAAKEEKKTTNSLALPSAFTHSPSSLSLASPFSLALCASSTPIKDLCRDSLSSPSAESVFAIDDDESGDHLRDDKKEGVKWEIKIPERKRSRAAEVVHGKKLLLPLHKEGDVYPLTDTVQSTYIQSSFSASSDVEALTEPDVPPPMDRFFRFNSRKKNSREPKISGDGFSLKAEKGKKGENGGKNPEFIVVD